MRDGVFDSTGSGHPSLVGLLGPQRTSTEQNWSPRHLSIYFQYGNILTGQHLQP